MIKVTIITLTYNSERFLSETLASVKMQIGIGEEFELEHIFVHAESTDNTLSLILQYQKDVSYSVRIVSDSEKKGITNALNLGILSATGEIVNHLHSDDFFSEDTVIQTVARYFLQKKHRRWCFSNFKLCNEASEITHFIERQFSYKQLIKYCIVPHPTVFIEKSVFDDFGLFDSNYKCAMDYEYWFRISYICRPHVFTKHYFSVFRTHADSTTEKWAAISAEETASVKQKYHKLYSRRYLCNFLQSVVNILKAKHK